MTATIARHGLGYNTYTAAFGHDTFTVSAAALAAGGHVSIAVALTSRGAASPTRSVLLFLTQKPATPTVAAGDDSGLPARVEWLGNFTKLGVGSWQNSKATATLCLGMDALSRWVPTGGAGSTSFTEGSYVVQKGEYVLRLADGTATAMLTVVA